MARYVSRRNPVSVSSLKRRPHGTVIVHNYGAYGAVRFTRCTGGWLCERENSFCRCPAGVVSSADVAAECNKVIGCKESWARIY